MWKKNSETFLACDRDYEAAKIVMFGAPFDGTTSFRPGTRFGPKAIRGDSFGIETYSPYQAKDLLDIAALDIGDIELPFGNTEKALTMIKQTTEHILADDKLPLMLGGEHLVTLGAMRAVAEKHPDVCVIHLDAHTDLREDYLGERLSHASVIRRVWELVGDGRIYQFGIRSGEKYEFEWAKKHTTMQRFNLDGFSETVKKLKNRPVYFTLDLDVLDPSVFPGTGTPEPGGISFQELLKAVTQLSGLNIVGCDVNELSPVYDPSGISTAAACKIVRELMLAVGRI